MNEGIYSYLKKLIDNKSYIEYEENGIKYSCKIDLYSIFKCELLYYVKRGLSFDGTATLENGGTCVYISMPKKLVDYTESPKDISVRFKKWMLYKMAFLSNISVDELSPFLEMKCKYRDENWSNEDSELSIVHFFSHLKMLERYKDNYVNKMREYTQSIKKLEEEQLKKLNITREELDEYFNNLPKEEKERLNNKVKEILKNELNNGSLDEKIKELLDSLNEEENDE